MGFLGQLKSIRIGNEQMLGQWLACVKGRVSSVNFHLAFSRQHKVILLRCSPPAVGRPHLLGVEFLFCVLLDCVIQTQDDVVLENKINRIWSNTLKLNYMTTTRVQVD